MNFNLERSGNLYAISPWPSALEPLASYKNVKIDYTGRRRKPEIIQENLYFKDDKEDKGYFPAGLIKRVKEWMAAEGHTCSEVDYRDVAALYPTPDFTKLPKLREGQDKVIVKVCTEDRGIIVCNTGFGKSFLICNIAKMYPTLRMVITAPGRDEVMNLYLRLTEIMPGGAVGIIGAGRNDDPGHRIIVTTNKSLKKADLDNCDLFLFDEVHACGNNEVARTLAHVNKARMFGFTATVEGRSDNAEIIMEAMFGKIVANFDYQSSVEAGTATQIEVWLYDIPGVPAKRKNMISRKRHAIWRNKIRNLSIAHLAKKFPAEEQVLIMVETVEHMMYLKKLLPEFTAVYGSTGKEDFEGYRCHGFTDEECITPKKREEYREQFKTGELKKVIATGVWKQGVDFPELAVLIRAEGAPSKILSSQIPGRLSRISDNKNKAILIDFRDTYDPWTAQRAKKRIITYRTNGWTVKEKGNPLDEEK